MNEHTFAVCAYKESPYLEECIESLKGQSVRSNILIATSTPNEYIKNIAEKNNIPYFINEGEGGITQDWNFAYSSAESKYITIAHQDDIYEKDYFISIRHLVLLRRLLTSTNNKKNDSSGKGRGAKSYGTSLVRRSQTSYRK